MLNLTTILTFITTINKLLLHCLYNLSFCTFNEGAMYFLDYWQTVTLSPVTVTYVCNRLKQKEKSHVGAGICSRLHVTPKPQMHDDRPSQRWWKPDSRTCLVMRTLEKKPPLHLSWGFSWRICSVTSRPSFSQRACWRPLLRSEALRWNGAISCRINSADWARCRGIISE